MGTWVRRLVAAMALASVALAAASSRAVACSGPPLTFEQVVTGSRLIVEGDVEEVLLNGLAYRLAVDEIFKGQATGATVRIGPQAIRAGVGARLAFLRVTTSPSASWT